VELDVVHVDILGRLATREMEIVRITGVFHSEPAGQMNRSMQRG
jgi:hypothetical protein